VATRLERALEELAQALRGRPYVLVFQQNHPDAPIQNIGTVRPSRQPLYASRGLLLEAQDFLISEAGDRSQLVTKEGGRSASESPKLADMGSGPVEWERDDVRITDTIAVICTAIRHDTYTARATVCTWTDEEARYAEEWAARELAYRQGDGEAVRWNRPKFLPEGWL